jgi:hypothetical protein
LLGVNASAENFTHVFIADEDLSLQRQSYQQAELFMESASLLTMLAGFVPVPLKPMSNADIYRRSLAKRWSGANQGSLASAVLVPAATTARELVGLLTRLSYFLPEASGIVVHIPVTTELLQLSQSQLLRLRSELGEKVYGELVRTPTPHIKLVDESELPQRMMQANVLRWIWQIDRLTAHEARLLSLSKDTLLADVDHPAMRSGFSSAYALYCCQGRARLAERRARSRRRLQTLVARVRDENRRKVAAFGTGPSLANAYDYDFSDVVTIACNTMVKDLALLRHIRPSIIVASDADFHFGPSRYAQKFRSDLCTALIENDAVFVCPEAHSDLLLSHHPEIEPRLIAIPVDGTATNYDLVKEFRARAIDNVLLQFLLPLATTLGREIQLLGFDGRRKSDVKFWNHNVNTQYPELMGTIEQSHPGFFFHRSYTDYFERHCNLIAEYAEGIEALGGRLQSLADSAVPALAKRRLSA